MSNDTHDFLVVETAGRWFALPTRVVEAAVAPRVVTPLPFVPPYVEGLVNVNERILPLIDLQRLLGAKTATEKGELVVIDTARAACVLRVQRVVGKADIGDGDVQSHNDDVLSHNDDVLSHSGEPGDDNERLPAIVCGRFDWEAQSVLVLDENVIGRSISVREETPGQSTAQSTGQRGLLGRHETESTQQHEDALDCVVFAVAGERYAIGLPDTLEILDLPAATPIPGAPVAAEGLSRVRDEVILVLSLAKLLRRGDSRENAHTVIVVERAGVRYGLRVDRLDGIRSFPRDALRRIDDDSSELVGVLTGDDALFGVVTPASLVNDTLHAALLPLVPRSQQVNTAQQETWHAVLQVGLGDEDFAIPLTQVRRIAEFRAAEPLRDGERGIVCGAVNVDGNVMPVVALGEALHAGNNNTGAWVIVGDDNHEWAIAVREAKQILEIPGSAIEEIGGRADGFVTAVANIDNRLLSLLSMAPLTQGNHPANATTVTHAREFAQ